MTPSAAPSISPARDPATSNFAQSITYSLAQATLPLDAVKISLESTANVSLAYEPKTISLTCTPGAGDTATLQRGSLTILRFASIG